jgi:hypothetical protein
VPTALLLDAHIATRVAILLRQRHVDALALAEWHAGAYLDLPDDALLRLAATERRTFVTFDVHTIPPLLRLLADTGIDHAGVILISPRSFRQDDFGGIARALEQTLQQALLPNTTNQVIYLTR